MTAEQIATIITTVIANLLTGGGLAIFVFYLIRGLKREIGNLNKTIEQQNKTLEVMEKRVIETEKVGNIYRDLIDDLPEQVSKYKKFLNETKDDVIAQLELAQDATVKQSRELELKRLELQEQMLAELPKLQEQLRTSFKAIQQRLGAMDSSFVPMEEATLMRWIDEVRGPSADRRWRELQRLARNRLAHHIAEQMTAESNEPVEPPEPPEPKEEGSSEK